MKKILVLGCGLVGGPIALDLAKDNDLKVSVADINKNALDRLNDERVKKIQANLPLTEIEHLEFDGIGTLEAFNSDGLRSLLFTIRAKNMKEKTLRYPGYANKVKLLADNGFFEKEKIDINGQKVSPLEVTARLLFRQWKLEKEEADITVMRIIVEGEKDGKNIRYQYDLHDEYDPASGIHSMARTTGYSAAMAVRLMAEGHFRETGITVPEMLGKNENHVLFILEGLKDRNIIYREKVVAVN